jgi:MFS superfamily sulfate permease-like transporter
VLASVIAGVLLMMIGVGRLGRVVAAVPHSIIVGFTIGIAIVIAFSQSAEVLGINQKVGYQLHEQLAVLGRYIGDINFYAVFVAIMTFAVCKTLIKVSTFIPAPLIGLGFGYVAAATFWSDKGLVLIEDRYGSIPTDFWVITPPVIPTSWTLQMTWDLTYFVLAIFFVAAVESLLCSRMADRLAGNKGIPFNPNKELWGQGLVNIVTPLFNGFPHTGALARTAVNIRLGAVSPLAGIAKFVFKLLLAAFLATYLEQVPMACIGGILMYIASGMVKTQEIKEVLSFKNPYHTGLMIYTAAMVPMFGFMTGVLTALIIYGALRLVVRERVQVYNPASEAA